MTISKEMAFIFDTNIFIRSKNDMPMDIWPSFWNTLSQLINDGKVLSCESVKTEIDRGNDELTDWIKHFAPKDFYIKADLEVMNMCVKTLSWANNLGRFSQNALNEYASVADAFLVATAEAKGHTLVTYEKPDPSCQRRVKIPDACLALNVSICDLNEAFRILKVTI